MSKVYEVAFKIGANVAPSFAKTMSGASGALGELNKTMSAMGKQQAANQRVLDLRESLVKTSKEFADAKAKADRLGDAIKNTSKPTKAMVREHQQAQQAVQRARDRMQQQAATLREVHRDAGAAGKSTAQLVSEQNKLAVAGERAAKAQGALQRNIAAQEANLQRRGELRGQMFDALALGALLAAPARQAMDWEQRLAEFNKVAGKTPGEVKAIATAAQEMAVATGVAREEILGAYIAAAQAGFDENEWEKYAEVAAKMGVAFDVSGEAAGEMLKAWRSSMGLSMSEAEKLAAAANHIANNMNATASDVGEVLQRQGAILRSAGLSSQQSAAFSAALLSGGATPEQAATAAKNIMLTLTKGMAATGTEKTALAALGFDDPARLAKAMQAAPEQAIMLVLERLQGISGDERTSIMGQLFGTSAVGAVAPLVTNMENLAGAFNLVRNESDYINSLQAEFDAMGSTTANQARKASESIKMITTGIGAALLPTINQLMAQFAPMALAFAKFAQENEWLIKLLVLTAASLIAAKVAAITLGYAWTFVRGAMLSLQSVVLATRTAWMLHTGAIAAGTKVTKGAAMMARTLTAAQWLLNAALLANPIGLVIAAVMALIGAGMLLYKYWDVVVAFLKGAWSGLVQGLAPLKESLSGLQPVFDALRMAFGKISSALSTMIGWFKRTDSSAESLEAAGNAGMRFGEILAAAIKIATWPLRTLINLLTTVIKTVVGLPGNIKSAFDKIMEFVKSFDLSESGRQIMTTMANGIKSAATAPFKAVSGALGKVRDMLPFSDAKVGPLSELTYSGMQIMQTLSKGIKAVATAPAKAVDGALGAVSGGLSGFAERGAPALAGGGMTISIEQNITLTGGADSYEQARRGAADGAQDLIQQLERAMAREERLSYGS